LLLWDSLGDISALRRMPCDADMHKFFADISRGYRRAIV
jgi:hypothetical protein